VADVLAGRYREAIPVLETLRRLLPDNVRAATLLGIAYLRTGAPKQAAPVVREALNAPTGAGRGDLNLHLLLVEALNGADDAAGALHGAQEAARLFPKEEKAQLCLAQQLAVAGKYQEAGPVFQRALELAPDNVPALLGLADVQFRSGSYQEALATYRRAAELDKSDAAAQVGIAKSLISLNRFAEAQGVLESAVAAHPDDYQLRFELSRVYARLGDKERAAEQARIMQQLRQRESSR
jgi:thioredoxin-like negative regulator of GroEL